MLNVTFENGTSITSLGILLLTGIRALSRGFLTYQVNLFIIEPKFKVAIVILIAQKHCVQAVSHQ
jgi:hypothetical protein